MLGIAFRLFALWCIVEIIFIMPSLLPIFAHNEGLEAFSSTNFYLISATFLSLGILLIFVIFKLGNSATKAARSEHINNEYNPELEKFLLQLVGVYFMVGVLSVIPGTITKLIIEFNQAGSITEHLAWITGYLVKILLGIHLIAKPKVWVTHLNKLRNNG